MLVTLFLIYLNNSGKLKKIKGIISGEISLGTVMMNDAMEKAGEIMDKTFPGNTPEQQAAWGLPDDHPKHPYNDPEHPSYRGGTRPIDPFKIDPSLRGKIGELRSKIGETIGETIGGAIGTRRVGRN